MFPLLSCRLETYAIISDDKEIISIKSEMDAWVQIAFLWKTPSVGFGCCDISLPGGQTG